MDGFMNDPVWKEKPPLDDGGDVSFECSVEGELGIGLRIKGLDFLEFSFEDVPPLSRENRLDASHYFVGLEEIPRYSVL